MRAVLMMECLVRLDNTRHKAFELSIAVCSRVRASTRRMTSEQASSQPRICLREAEAEAKDALTGEGGGLGLKPGLDCSCALCFITHKGHKDHKWQKSRADRNGDDEPLFVPKRQGHSR